MAALPAKAVTPASGFVIGEGPGKLVDSLIAGGYGPLNPYEALVQIQQNSDPSLAGVITPAFIATLAACPANSTIFTTTLSTYAGNGVAIYPDCTAAATYIQGSGFNGLSGNTTLATVISGVGSAAVVSLGTPFASDPTHTVFAILYAPQGPSRTFVLSNESSGHLITNMLAAGYGTDNLCQVLVNIAGNTNPGVSGVLTPSFLYALKYCATGSPVFATQLQNAASPVAISDDCSVQTRSLTGASFNASRELPR